MDSAIRILVIDDQEIIRLGLWLSLKDVDDIHFDGEAGDGPAGLSLVAQRNPDVAIVDMGLPGMDGVEVAEQIKEISPRTRIMLVSGWFDDEAIARGLELGVDGSSPSPIRRRSLPVSFVESRRVYLFVFDPESYP